MSDLEFQEEDDTIRLKREAVIEIDKKELIAQFCSCIDDPGERAHFQLFCQRLEQMLSLEFRARKEQLIELYDHFDPFGNHSDKLGEVLDSHEVKQHETRFLEHFANIMSKSNFKALSDYEWSIATSSQYLFRLPTRIKRNKLDDKLFLDTPYYNSSSTDLGRYYAVFRRGIGTDQRKAYFFKAKLDHIVQCCWDATVKKLVYYIRLLVVGSNLQAQPVLKSCQLSDTTPVLADATNITCTISTPSADKYVSVKRISFANSFKLTDFFKKFTLQDPTFDHALIVYRDAKDESEENNRKNLGIHVKHYKGIPMADLELILPAKKHPRLPLRSWIKLIVFGLICAAGIASAFRRTSEIAVVIGIIVAFVSYAMKVYNMNVLEYERDINDLMAAKLIDCGRGTLLHVLDEAVQQETKEAIIAYFVLDRHCGRSITEEELQTSCNEVIASYFEKGTSELDVKDAMDKLQRLEIISNQSGLIKHIPPKQANEMLYRKLIDLLL